MVVVAERLAGDFTEGTLVTEVPLLILYYSYCLPRFLEVKIETAVYIYPHFYSRLSLVICFFSFFLFLTRKWQILEILLGNGNLIAFFLSSYFLPPSLIF